MADRNRPDIVFTKVDEAPELASASLLPIVRHFAKAAGVSIGVRDISLAGRILAAFPERLAPAQRQEDDLAVLAELVQEPDAAVVKLPNISASVPQLTAAIRELQAQGHDLPDYPEDPSTPAEVEARARYDAIKGSAVNPVLREGNSDRRAAAAVKAYAKANPHPMGAWRAESRTRVSTMGADDFRSNERSATLAEGQAGPARIELVGHDGAVEVLKAGVTLPQGAIVDATFLSVRALRAFLDREIESTARDGLLFSIHLKATMMKVSDPIIFGHAVQAFLQPVFDRWGDRLREAEADPDSGLSNVLARVAELPERAAIEAAVAETLAARPPLYMVNSDRGITNLHVPSDVIIDASIPAILRAGGKGWGPDGREADVNCVIPDGSYAAVYDEAIRYFKETGALDPRTAGTVQNVGLMAQKAEEYGSHPTTFEVPHAGSVRIVLASGEVLHTHEVEAGDIWRAAVTRSGAVADWVRLAIDRQRAEGCEAIFWLDAARPHDAELIRLVRPALEAAGATDRFRILAPREATRATFETIRAGRTVIAVTGNVLRDYLTDLFPILELGTSAKMLSIVKLLNGGGLFETGAGGSAPKHVQQLMVENHLRWDSLGEFCALGEALRFVADRTGNARARLLGDAVDTATQHVLDHDRSPGRRAGEPDNRDSHFYFALYWAQALAAQGGDPELAARFAPLAAALAESEARIQDELRAARGRPVDLSGYYRPDPARVAAVMRPSSTLNAILG